MMCQLLDAYTLFFKRRKSRTGKENVIKLTNKFHMRAVIIITDESGFKPTNQGTRVDPEGGVVLKYPAVPMFYIHFF